MFSNSYEKYAKIYGPRTRHDRNQIQFAIRATCFHGNSNGTRDLRRFTEIYGDLTGDIHHEYSDSYFISRVSSRAYSLNEKEDKSSGYLRIKKGKIA